MISVLYVDDERDLLEIAQVFLEEEDGMKVQTLTSADDALHSPQIESCDVIISDYQMKGMDGIAFLKAIRERYGDLPFILFTGRGREEVVIDAINNGADFYLQKGGDPIAQFTELAHKIRQAVLHRRTFHALQASEQRLSDIINFLPDATFAIDTSGHVIAWNLAMEEMTGIAAADVTGRAEFRYGMAFYGKNLPMLVDFLLDTGKEIDKSRYFYISRAGASALTAEGVVHRPNGKILYIWGKASLLYDRNGEIAGAIESIRDISDRKRTEQSLHNTLEQYRTLLESEQDAVILMDWDLCIRCNRRTLAMFGYTDENQIVGHHPFAHAPASQPDGCDSEKRIREMVQAAYCGMPRSFEWLYLRADGTPLYSEVSLNRLILGEKTFLQAILRDISDRKIQDHILRTQLDLDLSLQKHPGMEETLTSCLGAAIAVSGLDAGWISLADEKTGSFNLAVAKNLPEDYTRRVSCWPAGSPDAQRAMAGTVECLSCSVQGSNPAPVPGQAGPGIMAVFPIRSGDRVTACMTLTSGTRDRISASGRVALETIAARIGSAIGGIRADEALRESEKKYRRLLETANEGVVIMDAGYGIRFINDKILEMLGYDRTGMIGKRFEAFIHQDDRADYTGRIQNRMAGIRETYEGRCLKSDGGTCWMLVSVTPVLDPGGEFCGCFAMLTDITERKLMEHSVREANRKLNLMSSITRHDILNQLTILQGFTRIAAMKQDDPEQKDLLSRIDTAAVTISRQIEFTRTYQELGVHNPVWIRLDEIRNKPAFRDVTFLTSCNGKEIYADPMLEMVFFNLMDNATRHGGHVTAITVSCEQSDAGLTVIVEDNGIGIPLNEKEKIFERGFGKNTGLGLFLVREVLLLTGISIRETGVPGTGARFEMLVPDGTYRQATVNSAP